jgi:O6-methylguanine-DNA--protein-cysteine methyltransferase
MKFPDINNLQGTEFPCHRVVAKNSLGGYAGARTGKLIEIKK